MTFDQFKEKYQKAEVVEFANSRQGKNSLVTIRVLTYNHAPFIRECLDSLIMQKTSFDYEILIAEDESTDGTREICIEYAEKHPDKIRLLLNSRENNIFIDGKPTGVFNVTYANFSISSKYIAIMEADDYWVDETSLQKRADFLEKNPDFSFCYHDSYWWKEGQPIEKSYLEVNSKCSLTILPDQIMQAKTTPTTMMYRNGVIEKFDEKMAEILCGALYLKGKLAVTGKARFMHDIKPSIHRRHEGGSHHSLSAKKRMEASLLARKFLISKLEKQGEERVKKSTQEGIATIYFQAFLKVLARQKSIEWTYLKEGQHFARQSGIRSFPIIWNLISSKLRRKVRQEHI